MLEEILERIFPVQIARAHCDIPCGIYDPHSAQLAAHTVVRMTALLKEVKNDPDDNTADFKIARLTRVKEDHAEVVKHEVRVIWGDYFKPETIEKFSEVNELVFNIMKSASKAKQEVNPEVANDLLGKVQQFAEIFWKSKGLETKRCDSTFPTGGEIVVPKFPN